MDPLTLVRPVSIRFWILFAVFAWCAIPLSPFKVDSDFWGHVQYGFDVFDHGLPSTATYTYTSEGYRWINHENLSEIIFGFLVRHLGSQFVLMLKCLCGCGVIGLILVQALRKQVATWIIATTMALVAVNLSYFWGVRPQFFSFTFFALLIYLYETRIAGETIGEASTSSRISTLLLIGSLFLAWTNTHGGFLAGVGVFGLLTFLQLVRQATLRQWRSFVWCALFGLVALAITFVNPYGIELHIWLLESLRVPRPEIFEWHPPNMWTNNAIKIWLVLALSFVSFAATRKKRDWIQIATLLFVVCQALAHQRHLPFVAILFGFWVPQHLDDAFRRWMSATGNEKANATRTGPTVTSSAHCVIALSFAAMALVFAIQVGSRLGKIVVSTERYPVDAVQFMHDHDLQGRTIVTGEWAQYLLHTMGARTERDEGCRLAFDGRFRTCYPQSVIDMHFDFFEPNTDPNVRYRSPESPPIEPAKILHHLSPQFILLKQTETFPISVLQRESNWQMIYADSTSQLWSPCDRLAEDSSGPNEPQIVKTPQRFVLWPAGPETDKNTRFVSH